MSKLKENRNEIQALYGGDPRYIPLYTLPQVSRYLKIPLKTLRSWVKGRSYPIGQSGQKKFFKPVITPPDPKGLRLSFINLVEAHVLNGIRRVERVTKSGEVELWIDAKGKNHLKR